MSIRFRSFQTSILVMIRPVEVSVAVDEERLLRRGLPYALG